MDFKILATAAILVLGISSCKDDDDSTADTPFVTCTTDQFLDDSSLMKDLK